MVVFPEDSGPKISTTRPRGKPPTPSAASKEIAPVEITAMGTMASFDPRRMIEPLPNCFSICANARSIALLRSSAMKDAPSRITGCVYRQIRYADRSEEKANLVKVGGKGSQIGAGSPLERTAVPRRIAILVLTLRQ